MRRLQDTERNRRRIEGLLIITGVAALLVGLYAEIGAVTGADFVAWIGAVSALLGIVIVIATTAGSRDDRD